MVQKREPGERGRAGGGGVRHRPGVAIISRRTRRSLRDAASYLPSLAEADTVPEEEASAMAGWEHRLVALARVSDRLELQAGRMGATRVKGFRKQTGRVARGGVLRRG